MKPSTMFAWLIIVMALFAGLVFSVSNPLVNLRDPGAAGDSTTIESDSGLEFINNELTIIRGCDDNAVLDWDDAVDDDWNCSNDLVMETIDITEEFTMSGDGRVTKELRINISALTLGVTAPDQEITETIGAAGNLLIPTLAFNPGAAQDQVTYFTIHMPDDVDGTQNIEFHLMWKPDQTYPVDGDDYHWSLEYLVTTETADTTVGAPTTIFESVIPANATNLIETEFVATIDADAQRLIHCRLVLDVGLSAASEDGHVTFVEIEYYADKLGEAIP